MNGLFTDIFASSATVWSIFETFTDHFGSIALCAYSIALENALNLVTNVGSSSKKMVQFFEELKTKAFTSTKS